MPKLGADQIGSVVNFSVGSGGEAPATNYCGAF